MHTTPPIYEYVMTHLRAKTIQQRTIARESGVPFSTLCKIAQGQITNPPIRLLFLSYYRFDRLFPAYHGGDMSQRIAIHS
jgi:transcriptional regulator with XRE-family HTH domain